MIVLSLLVVPNLMEQGMECGTDTIDVESSFFGEPCFDVEEVDEVFIKVVVHFFLDDECEGDLAAAPSVQVNLDPKNAWQIARKMIDDANNHFVTMSENPDDSNHQWNSQLHGKDPSPAHPIPIRYILHDVLIHCDTDGQQNNVSSQPFSQYLVAPSTYLNIFISHITTSTNGFFSNFGPMIVNEHFGSGLFNHEVGHFLYLPHTHDAPNYCNDTWNYVWDWEPCNASNEYNKKTCWDHTPKYNGLDACDVNLFCEPHPCCWWGAQNNNLMTYSAWAGNPIYCALTQCQLASSLGRLSTVRCDYVEAVNPPCAPVSAIASTIIEEGSCKYCIDLRASMHGTSYKLDFYKIPSMDLVSTGWIQGTPTKYCWNSAQKKPGSSAWMNGLLPETEYEMVLSVRNACDEVATYDRLIETPIDCGSTSVYDAVVDIEVAPNPFSGEIQVNYEIFETADVLIYVIHPTAGVYSNGFINEGTKSAGTYAVNFQTSTWASGNQYLVFLVNGIASSTILIKN